MPNRPAIVTQADISRAIRAMKQEGFDRVRVLVFGEGVSVEPYDGHRQEEIATELRADDERVLDI